MKFYTIKKEIEMVGDVLDLWRVLALNFGHIADYSKGLRESTYTSEQKIGIGTSRHCVMINGGFMKEEIIEWEDAKSLAFQIVDSSLPLQQGCSLLFTIQSTNDNLIHIIVQGKYRLRYLGFLSLLIYPIMTQMINQYLEDMQNAIAA
ncbi:MAG: hypothetical protein AAFZ63_22415 [Bacteroidota bacterium]